MELPKEGIIRIIVKTGQKEQGIYAPLNGLFAVHIKERPIDNKANIAVIRLLKKMTKKDISIIQGRKSRIKTIKIS